MLQPVSDSAHCCEFQAAVNRFQTAAQEMDIIIQVAALDVGIRPPDAQQERGAGKCLFRMAEKKSHQISLASGERTGVQTAGEKILLRIPGKTAEGQKRAGGEFARPPPDTADACHQLFKREWFHNIVVRSAVKPCDAFLEASQGGQKDYRRCDLFRAHDGQNLQSVEPRKHPVKQDQIVCLLPDAKQPVLAVVTQIHGNVLALELERERLAEDFIIFNQKNAHKYSLCYKNKKYNSILPQKYTEICEKLLKIPVRAVILDRGKLFCYNKATLKERQGRYFMELYEMKELEERVLLVGVQSYAEDDTEKSLEELGDLAMTAGASVAGTVIQRRESVHPGTYIGRGKIEEVRDLLYETQATGIICDDELSPAQMNNLQDELNCKVMDRTLLILDIFARHATTREGKIQVELAQLRYRSARLTGLGNSLSRLGGGIGTRGPGEKKLEVDRRVIRERISHLKRELEEVVRHRELLRAQRVRGKQKIVSLVGYTSVGKSALFNCLTGAGVLEDAKLFATLDTTTRALTLSGKQEVLLTDTVGFIRKLPHHLVEAFRSTLEETLYADILIHVVDVSSEQMENQMFTVYETLRELGVRDKPVITVFNKADLLTERRGFRDFRAEYSILASAKSGEGLDQIREAVEEVLRGQKIYVERLYPYEKAGIIQLIRRKGELVSEEYLPEGISVKAYVPQDIYGKI